MDMTMEELHMAASAYYSSASSEIQGLVRDFFNSMDLNRDGGVSYNELSAFCWQYGYHLEHDIFVRLDRNRDNMLDFWEVVTLYYIIKARGVWCRSCGVRLMNLYFTCVTCFDSHDNTYDLCVRCYSPRNVNHHHSCFLDSYMLLRSRRGLPASVPNPNPALVPLQSTQNAPWRSWWTALQALEMGLTFANIFTACSIM